MTEFQEKMIKKLRKIRELSKVKFIEDELDYYYNTNDSCLTIIVAKTFVMFKVLDGVTIYGHDIEYVGNEMWFYNDGHIVSMIPYHVFFGRGA